MLKAICLAIAGAGLASTASFAQDVAPERFAVDGDRLTANASILYMGRSDPDDDLIFTYNGTASEFRGDDLDLDFSQGFQADVTVQVDPRWDVGVRGIFIGHGTSDALGTSNGFFRTSPATAFAAPTLEVDFDSNLASGEANVGYDLGYNIRVFGGPRYLNFSEDVTITSPTVFTVGAETDNDLYGGQIGVSANWRKGRFVFDALAKGGVFYNRTSNEVYAEQPIGARIGTFSGDYDHTSYMIEGAVGTRFDLTEYVSLSAGYNFLWLANVATSTAQFPKAGLLTSGNGQQTSGIELDDVLFHGFRAGLTVRF